MARLTEAGALPAQRAGRKWFARVLEGILEPGRIFLLLGLLTGGLYCIFIPYGAGFDEETHLVRVMDIAYLHMLPNRSKNATVTYQEFFSLSYQRRYFNSPASDLFLPENFQKKLDLDTRNRIQTRSIYAPEIFFPQAFVAAVFWRLFNAPVLPVVILMRLTGLLLYLLAGYLTIRMLPLGKWVFAILALSPMALFQAATINADGFTNAVSFLYIGLALQMALQRETPIRPWQVGALALLAVLLGLSKPGSIVLLPLLLILPFRRFPSTRWAAALAAGALAAVAVTVLWTAISVPHSHFAESGAQDVGRQLDLILTHPLDFAVSFVTRTITSTLRYFRDWVGVYGYWVGEVPEPVYWFYPLALLAALLAEPPTRMLSGKMRLFLAGLFLVSAGGIALLYYYLHYIPGDWSSLGKQGRYFIPMAPLLCIAAVGLLPARPVSGRIFSVLSSIFLLAAVGFYSFGLYATYYTECGYAVYAGQSCRLPVYKNLDIYNPLEIKVEANRPISQDFVSHCGRVESVQVLVNSVSASGVLRYSLLDSRAQVLASQDFPVSAIPAKEFLTLPVNPPAAREDARYQIRLESVDAGAGGVGIALRDGNYYREGKLLAGGEPVGVDSIFFYSCPNLLLKK